MPPACRAPSLRFGVSSELISWPVENDLVAYCATETNGMTSQPARDPAFCVVLSRKGASRLLCIALVCLPVFLSMSGVAGGSTNAEKTTGGCGNRVTVDYLLPLSKLPPASPPPQNGQLGFASKQVSLYPVMDGLVQNPDDLFGYAFSFDGDPSDWNPGWKVEATLSRVDHEGTSGPVLLQRRRALADGRDLGALDFGVPLGFGKGLFLYQLKIKNRKGTLLRAFDQYARVLPRRVAMNLWVESEHYRPEDSVRVQVRNPGTVPIRFAPGGSVDVQTAGGWSPTGIYFGSRKRVAVVIPPGQSSRCYAFKLPGTIEAGNYRVRMRAGTNFWKKSRSLLAYFDV